MLFVHFFFPFRFIARLGCFCPLLVLGIPICLHQSFLVCFPCVMAVQLALFFAFVPAYPISLRAPAVCYDLHGWVRGCTCTYILDLSENDSRP